MNQSLNDTFLDYYKIEDIFETLKYQELSCMILSLFSIACSQLIY